MPLSRRTFLGVGSAAALGAAAVTGQGSAWARPQAYDPLPETDLRDETIDTEFLKDLAGRNDAALLAGAGAVQDYLSGGPAARWCVVEAKKLVAAYSGRHSAHHGDAEIAARADELLAHVQDLQTEVGLFDAGNNLESPPDSCFSLTDLVIIRMLIDAEEGDGLDAVATRLDELVPSVARAVVEVHGGGVHTANHRWEVAGALLAVNAHWPDEALVTRAEEWLAEGIDVFDDGQYSERSAQYASEVVNPSLLRIAEHTQDGGLLELVRGNLRVTQDITDDDGTVQTVQSRRQDQWRRRDDSRYVLQLREFAIRDDDAAFARRAEAILEEEHEWIGEIYADVLARPALARRLPEGSPHEVPDRVDLLESSGLLRLQTGGGTLTCFAGSDHPEFGRTASGLSTNPTFLQYRRGAIELSSVRIAPRFFSMGPLRPHELTEHRGTVQMQAAHSTGYHRPLRGRSRIRQDGMYDLEDDGRFYSAMNFSERKLAEVRFDASLAVTPEGSGWSLQVEAESPSVVTVLQLVFAGDGELTFDGDHSDAQNPPPEATAAQVLRSGGARWSAGGESLALSFEGVDAEARDVALDSGEEYSYMGGQMPTSEGTVLLVPFRAPGTFTMRVAAD